MAFLFLFFTTVLTLCVVGLIVLALASILASVRDDWKLKRPKQAKPRRGATDLQLLVRGMDHDLAAGAGIDAARAFSASITRTGIW